MAGSGMSNYAKRMARLASQIFVEVARPTDIKSTKVVRLFQEQPLNLNQELMDYYPKHKETDILIRKLRFHGLYRDEHLDFKEEMYRLKKLRGKGKPKKGEGKRALKRAS